MGCDIIKDNLQRGEKYIWFIPNTNLRTDILPKLVAVFTTLLPYQSVIKYRRTRYMFTKSDSLYARL